LNFQNENQEDYQMVPNFNWVSAFFVAGFCLTTQAAVSPEEAKQLGGGDLTVWGAEKSGNKEGTIPAYTGERPKVPASYNPKEPGNYPDLYPNEKPLFSITAQNMAQYANNMTDGQKEMFKRYPNFRMEVYPTHRTSASSPQILANTIKNATSCKAVNNGLRLEGCTAGFPFPIPKTGNEAVWNHVMSDAFYLWEGKVNTYIVDTSGKPILLAQYHALQKAPYLDPALKDTVLPSNTYYWAVRFDANGPARRIGEKTVILDSMDPLDPGRRAWSYIPGQRRVKLAPDLAYDTPNPGMGGTATMDQTKVFLGAQDRYDMKLLGKKEVFLVYNTNKITDYRVCPIDVSHTKNFINPNCVRWELHRAWVVQATLKPGFRHILPKRVLYFDEDSWSAGTGDSWDASGHIYRIDNVVSYPAADLPYGQYSDMSLSYDLQTGLVGSTAGGGFPGGGYHPVSAIDKITFSPEGLAAEGIR
jgi:Protein of unknown function (DUF1329)